MWSLESTARRSGTVAALLLSMVSGDALAQACLGVPISSGQFALDGGVTMYLRPDIGFGDAGRTELQFIDYSLGFTGMRGAGTAGITYTFSNIRFMEETGHAVNGRVGFELPITGISICPHLGVGHLRASQDNFVDRVSITQTWVPVGFGIGGPVWSGVTLFAVPQYWYLRETENFEPDFVASCGAPGDVEQPRETSCTTSYDGVNIIAGIRFGTSRLFGGASISVNLVDPFIDRQVGLGARIGYMLGPRH